MSGYDFRMRIGLFTDTYHPATNGIVTVVDITRSRLEEAGHEVYVFCPGTRSDRKAWAAHDDDHVIWLPAMPAGIFEGSRLAVLFPPRQLRKIKALELDVIHFLTPTQVGLLGVYAAQRTGAVLVAQHCTDLTKYAAHYPTALPGVLALSAMLPWVFRLTGMDYRTLLSMYRPRGRISTWNAEAASATLAMIYSRCDRVIALSRKSVRQLESSTGPYSYDVELLPTGVDPLPKPAPEDVAEFHRTWGIGEADEVIGYVGRLGAEKNLELLIQTFALLAPHRPRLKLLFVGDFNHRARLEELAQETGHGDRIFFTGRLPRNSLGIAYATLDVFLFPSITDTQGLVLHEAAAAGCPLILVDGELSEVLADGDNGYVVRNDAYDMAKKTAMLLDAPILIQQFSHHSRSLAAQFSEKNQVARQIALYERLVSGG